TKIDFMRLRKPVLILMLVIAVASVGVIVGKGFNYALEFTGGTLVQTSFQKTVDVDQVREQLAKAGFENAQVQNARGGNEVMIRLQAREQHN
ncbi:MAG: protein translocase subunit SecF, partial [Xanthomonas perforans]|nr:protein translocase subunit SecF [Xanthomonas perforans]